MLRNKLVTIAHKTGKKARERHLERAAHLLRAQQQGAGRVKVAKEESRGNANERHRSSRQIWDKAGRREAQNTKIMQAGEGRGEVMLPENRRTTNCEICLVGGEAASGSAQKCHETKHSLEGSCTLTTVAKRPA